MFIRYNCNPLELEVGDCVIRAISTALNFNWFMVHDELSHLSRKMADMPSSNRVWKEYLRSLGLVESVVDTECPNCITVDKFARRNNEGTYIVSTCEFTKTNDIVVTGTHLVAVKDGDYYDTWDSGADIPLTFFFVPENVKLHIQST